MKSLTKFVSIGLFLITILNNGCERVELNERTTTANINSKTIQVLTEENFNEFIPPVKQHFLDNLSFVDEFITASRNGTLQNSDIQEMLNILNMTSTTIVEDLHRANIKSGIYDDINNRRMESDFPNFGPNVDCDKLIEIRDAMLEECDQYPFGIDELCSGAVMLAYWYKSEGC